MAISKTQGAVILDEVINRHKIERHRGAFCRVALEAGGPEHFMAGWDIERARFTRVKANYSYMRKCI